MSNPYPQFLPGDGSIEAIRADHAEELRRIGSEDPLSPNPYMVSQVSALLAEIDRLRTQPSEALIERVVKSDFMIYRVYGGYTKEAKQAEWQRMRNIELNTFKRRLQALMTVLGKAQP